MNILTVTIGSFLRSALVSAINVADQVRSVAAFNETITEGDWIRIAPYGEHGNKVGLQIFDRAGANSMVEAFNSVETKLATMFRGLPIYEGHPDDDGWKRANPGIKVSAVGRVKKLDAREDGLYGLAAWNETGERLVRGNAPAYTAQSPHWGMKPIPGRAKVFQPVELWSLGLTNQPNITGTHLGLNEIDPSSPMKEILIKLLAALGTTVAADAADEAIITAANAAISKAGPAKAAAEGELAAAKNESTTLKTQLTAAQNEVTTLKGQVTTLTTERDTQKTSAVNERTARATVVITGAINEGRLKEAQRAEFTTKLVGAPDFDAAATEIGKLTKAINTTSKVAGVGDRKGETDTVKVSAINEAVSKKMKDTNLPHHEAYMAVKREQPALFSATNA